jgi:glycosyltransferase involved in cell wall biosynthesis
VTQKRIALIIPTLDRSGAEKQFTLLATRLPRDRFEPQVLVLTRTGPYWEKLASAGVPVTLLEKRFKFDPAALWRLRRWLAEFQPDVIHTWLFAANAYGRLAGRSAPQAKLVVSERCVDSWKQGWQLWLDRRLIARTDRLVGNSQSVVEFYRKLGFPDQKLVCIPNGIDLAPPLSANRQAMLDELGWPEEASVMGFIGRLAQQKRVEDLIFAVETLRQTRPAVRLLLIGDGPQRSSLERFARDVGCEEHVRFLGQRTDIDRWLALMDVFCLASAFEGMSNSLMEAMAAGKPAVVSDIPPNRELVTQGETGFLVPVGDRVGYMQFLRALIEHRDLAARLGAAARARMQEHFRVEQMVERYVAVYEELMTDRE